MIGSRAKLVKFSWLTFWVGYHWWFFAKVNPAAWAFGILFLVEAGLLAASPWIFHGSVAFAMEADLRSICGVSMIIFSALVYPLWGFLAGHIYPAMPMFGVAPCPTAIFTIGVLLMGEWRSVRWLLIIPGIWSVIGGSAVLVLRVPQDVGLIVTGALLVLVYMGRWRGFRAACHVRHSELH